VTSPFPLADEALAAVVSDRLALVEERLRDAASHTDLLADATSRHLVAAGGKRLRPMLTLLAAQFGEGSRPEVVDAAVVVELTHLASLYHDDVMDSAPVRRGAPAAHEVWGNQVAILTGDLLFAKASRLVANLGPEAVRIQSATFERLCLGQLHETIGPRADEDPIAHYLQVLADKTGSLIALAALLGVIFSEGSESFQEPVGLFGERIGVAFQLIDDVIDLSPSPGETGKAAGTDLRAGVPTLPLLYLRDAAESDADAAALLARIERSADADDAELARIVAALREHDVTRATLTEARRWSALAVQALDPLPDGPVKKALTKFAEAIVERSA
jgi:heptaprenyl diphosphate synthase